MDRFVEVHPTDEHRPFFIVWIHPVVDAIFRIEIAKRECHETPSGIDTHLMPGLIGKRRIASGEGEAIVVFDIAAQVAIVWTASLHGI